MKCFDILYGENPADFSSDAFDEFVYSWLKCNKFTECTESKALGALSALAALSATGCNEYLVQPCTRFSHYT